MECNCPFGDFGRHRFDCAAYVGNRLNGDGYDGAYGDPGRRREPPAGKAAWPELATTEVLDPDDYEEPKTA